MLVTLRDSFSRSNFVSLAVRSLIILCFWSRVASISISISRDCSTNSSYSCFTSVHL